MEDKIEVNEYVRTRAGHINKITNIDENGLIYWNKIQCGWSEQQLEDIIVKHSKDLLDLVEIGDYVNEERIIEKWDTRVGSIRSNFHEEDIETILTKEKYMANCYKSRRRR